MVHKELLTKVFHIENHTFMMGDTKFIFDWSSIGGGWRFDYSNDIVYVKKEDEENSKRKIFSNPNEIGNNPYSDLEFYINVAQAYGLNIYELIDGYKITECPHCHYKYLIAEDIEREKDESCPKCK